MTCYIMSVAWCKIPRLHSFCIPGDGNHFRLRNNHDVDSAILNKSVRGRMPLAGDIPRCLYVLVHCLSLETKLSVQASSYNYESHKNWINMLFDMSLLHLSIFYHKLAHEYVCILRICSRNECILP
jgi:hypothetical protein